MVLSFCTTARAFRGVYFLATWVGLLLLANPARGAEPVEFTFNIPRGQQNPFAREVWAEVVSPSGQIVRLPAFYNGGDRFSVRARATEAGDYRLGQITEKTDNGIKSLVVTATATVRQVVLRQTLPQVGLDQSNPSRFALAGSNIAYTPIGANLAWASEGGVKFFQQAFPQFAAEGLNWSRVWMAHWDGLNLDWLPEDFGDSPLRGRLDLRVAKDWDQIVSAAEASGIYLQIVLQHHGQLSTKVNANWLINPWNAANPRGYLRHPKDFFTSTAALETTRLKYRYIVARWGYSPAVLAWELFNEVHWVDPIKLNHDESVVAQWHARMADYIRSVDSYGHLVTTSTENLRSAIYDRMDFYQPHLYAYSILSGPLSFNTPVEKLSRPVFYGEVGDDHAPLSDEQKNSGIAIVPPVWASLMGPGRYPAQAWLGEKLLQTHLLGELGAVARFHQSTGLGTRQDLKTFSPRLECAEQVPFVLEAGQVWQRRASPEFVLPLDGRIPLEVADIPRAYVGSPKSLADGMPGRATYHVEFPRPTTLHARLLGAGAKGTAIRISVGGKIAVEKSWAPGAADAPAWNHPVELTFTAPAGPQTLVVENPGAEDWFQLDQIATDLPVPALTALGKRNENFLALWLWHRTGVFALQPPAPVGGMLLLDAVPAGKWTVTWWDTIKGIPAPTIEIEHSGGLLPLPVPAFSRHSAVVLTR